MAPETREWPRTVQGRTAVETGPENQGAIEAPVSAQVRYGPGPRISMQAGGKHRCDAPRRQAGHAKALGPTLGIEQGGTRVPGGVHTQSPWLNPVTHFTPLVHRGSI